MVFGGGKGGKSLASDLAKRGQRVAMVERGMIGGSCINVACIPSKTLIRSAKVAELLGRAAEFGIRVQDPAVEMVDVRQRKRNVVEGMIAINKAGFEASGMDFILGEAAFIAPKTLEVRLADGSLRTLTGERVFINTGTRAAITPAPGMEAAAPLTHVGALELEEVPKHLIVIGGGYIGLELGQAFRRFGSKVTVIHRSGHLLTKEDPDVAEAVLEVLRQEGIDVYLSAAMDSVEGRSGDHVRIRMTVDGKSVEVEGTHILVAGGRLANTEGIGLEKAGVDVIDRGFVKVNERLETTAPGVWALGDVAGSPMFTHVSFDDYRIVIANLHGGNRTTKDRLIPYSVFIDPELAHVGLHEADAKKQGLKTRVAKLPMAAVPRARTIGETAGFMKAMIDADTGKILGFTMFGAEAGEVVATVQMAMLAGLPYTTVRDAVLAHPTIAEGLNLLFAAF